MNALRHLLPSDRDRLFEWRNAPDVARHMYTSHAISRDEHDRWFDAIAPDATRRYWIIEYGGDPVGLVNLADISLAHRRCSWAYYLAEPESRGKGIGGAVEFAIIDHVLVARGFNKLWCEVVAANEPVWRLHENFGFVREALYREHIVKDGTLWMSSDWGFWHRTGPGYAKGTWRDSKAAD